jgi:hypothetical protein
LPIMPSRRSFVTNAAVGGAAGLGALSLCGGGKPLVDVCATEPERAARLMVDRGVTPRYDYALQALNELPYNLWRDYVPEDTVR